jgi:hypothetical protein
LSDASNIAAKSSSGSVTELSIFWISLAISDTGFVFDPTTGHTYNVNGTALVMLGYDPLDTGFYASGLIDGGAILPYPSLGAGVLKQALFSIHEQFAIGALLPGAIRRPA